MKKGVSSILLKTVKKVNSPGTKSNVIIIKCLKVNKLSKISIKLIESSFITLPIFEKVKFSSEIQQNNYERSKNILTLLL